jgi:site-specific recombinase XerD
MVDHGLRQEEAMRIAVEDIDEAHRTIQVLGKGNKYRAVPFMSDRFEHELGKLLAVRRQGPLVVNPKTGKPYVTIWKAIKRAAKAAEITREVNHHLLRHTFSALTAENGMNPPCLATYPWACQHRDHEQDLHQCQPGFRWRRGESLAKKKKI